MVVLGFAEGNAVQLVPDGTIVIHIVLILLMIWILNRTFFRPINRVLDARERNKGGRSSEAQGILHDVGEKMKRYNAAMQAARVEGYSLIESQRATAIAERQSRVESVKAEVEQAVAQETDAIRQQADQARGALARDARTMADRISSNILKTN